MASGEEGQAGEATLGAIPLSVASEAPAAPRRRFQLVVPRFVDYLIVATFIYFVF
jgi:hypothetical protein